MRRIVLGSLLAAIFASSSSLAAEPVALSLQVNGEIVQGDNPQQSLGRANTIECVELQAGASAKNNKGTLVVAPHSIVCRKRLDRATPTLLSAVAEQAPVDLVARFFRPSPNGDGTTEQYYSVIATGGLVTQVAQVSPNALSADSANLPAMEEVTFLFASVEYVWENGGVSAIVP